MISIYCKEQGDAFWCDIEGHANQGEYGSDIVCASVSAIAQALACRIMEITDKDIPMRNGEVRIHGTGDESLQAFYTCLAGFKRVEQAFPGVVSVTVDHL